MKQPLKPYYSRHFRCDKCQSEFYRTTSYSPNTNSKLTYCTNCVKIALSDKRITHRTKQLNLKVKEQTYWQLKKLALKEKCLMTEMLEKVLESYGKQKK